MLFEAILLWPCALVPGKGQSHFLPGSPSAIDSESPLSFAFSKKLKPSQKQKQNRYWDFFMQWPGLIIFLNGLQGEGRDRCTYHYIGADFFVSSSDNHIIRHHRGQRLGKAFSRRRRETGKGSVGKSLEAVFSKSILDPLINWEQLWKSKTFETTEGAGNAIFGMSGFGIWLFGWKKTCWMYVHTPIPYLQWRIMFHATDEVDPSPWTFMPTKTC